MTGKRQFHKTLGETYLTRSAALRKLQLSLAAFRKLCILKGVYPREPKKKRNPNKIYYLKKDILFLYHDPLVAKIREQKVFSRKIARAEGLKDRFKLIQLRLQFPQYTLDHIMRERYPSFTDAISDLDDALSLVVLMAQLPQTNSLKRKRIIECERLYNEFESFIVRSHSLRKVFVSIKGIYYQAEIEGVPVTWISPHEHTGTSTGIKVEGVDFKVLVNFLELYEAMLGFVLFKLYHSINLRYPPLPSLQLQSHFAKQEDNDNDSIFLHYYLRNIDNNNLMNNSTSNSNNMEVTQPSQEQSQKMDERLKTLNVQKLVPIEHKRELTTINQNNNKEKKLLFSGLTFFISREVPRNSLYFVIRSFGGNVLFREIDESNDEITHQIADRNSLKKRVLSRVYVQPQWVYDSINENTLLNTIEYSLGKDLPPHLSPFVMINQKVIFLKDVNNY